MTQALHFESKSVRHSVPSKPSAPSRLSPINAQKSQPAKMQAGSKTAAQLILLFVYDVVLVYELGVGAAWENLLPERLGS